MAKLRRPFFFSHPFFSLFAVRWHLTGLLLSVRVRSLSPSLHVWVCLSFGKFTMMQRQSFGCVVSFHCVFCFGISPPAKRTNDISFYHFRFPLYVLLDCGQKINLSIPKQSNFHCVFQFFFYSIFCFNSTKFLIRWRYRTSTKRKWIFRFVSNHFKFDFHSLRISVVFTFVACENRLCVCMCVWSCVLLRI